MLNHEYQKLYINVYLFYVFCINLPIIIALHHLFCPHSTKYRALIIKQII